MTKNNQLIAQHKEPKRDDFMKATEAELLPFLNSAPQFRIPIYQRTYSWTIPECRQLWEDIIRTGENENISAHFIGSIVYIKKGHYQVTNWKPLLVIDGQQRLTTISLLIEALARQLGETEPMEGFSAENLRNLYLLNPFNKDEKHYKLLLTQTDKESLLALLEQRPWPANFSFRVKENFEFFEEQVKKLDRNFTTLYNGLLKLMIVDVSLSRSQDNPQLIFESMNSTGKELSQADLIRNFILMGLEPNLQDQLYKDYWRPMELAFGQEAYGKHFDGFMRHYLTVKTGEIPKIRKVYEAFKNHAHSFEIKNAGVNALVADIHAFAIYYCSMALGKEPEKKLAKAFQDLRELKVDVAYPLLLELYHDYTQNLLTVDELEHAVRLVESYVFRRAICAIPTNSMNKTFANFGRSLLKERYLDSIRAQFMFLPSYRRFPDDEEFRRELKVRNLYNFRNRSYWLRRLENHDRKERVPVDEYTIEHIMPQNENLSQQWQDVLGPEWQHVQKTWLHTLGNLTLTGYNSEYSDRPFAEKRDMAGGFRESPLRVNEGLRAQDTWNETTIKARADRLARTAGRVWLSPKLPPEVLETYRPKKKGKKAEKYTIDDHPYLSQGSEMYGDLVPRLFRGLRKELLALDPCVSEGFRKRYVAYKAEVNFVYVSPRAKRLRLLLNMDFHEIQDPKGVAKDITGLGSWSHGKVELGLSSEEEIPYAMGLIRQAFEKQMGNGGEQE